MAIRVPGPTGVEIYGRGLFSVAEIRDIGENAGLGEVGVQPNDVYEFVTHKCSNAGLWLPGCADTNPPKTFAAGDVVQTGTPVAVKAEYNCFNSDGRGEAAERLSWSEQQQVENWFYTQNLQAGTVTTPNGTTVTPLVEAVGVIEEYLNGPTGTGGTGLLHISRRAAADVSNDQLGFPNTRHVFSLAGNRWVFGGGYNRNGPAGDAAGVNEAWLWATGEVVILRGPVFRVATPRPNNTNNRPAEAFRLYVPIADCPLVAVKVSL